MTEQHECGCVEMHRQFGPGPHDVDARHPNPRACEHAEYPERPLGYWSADAQDITFDQWEAIRDGLREATRQGQTIIVLEGITLTWHDVDAA